MTQRALSYLQRGHEVLRWPDEELEEAAVVGPERPVLVDKARSVGRVGAQVGALLPGELAATGDVSVRRPLVVCDKGESWDGWPEREVVGELLDAQVGMPGTPSIMGLPLMGTPSRGRGHDTEERYKYICHRFHINCLFLWRKSRFSLRSHSTSVTHFVGAKVE